MSRSSIEVDDGARLAQPGDTVWFELQGRVLSGQVEANELQGNEHNGYDRLTIALPEGCDVVSGPTTQLHWPRLSARPQWFRSRESCATDYARRLASRRCSRKAVERVEVCVASGICDCGYRSALSP